MKRYPVNKHSAAKSFRAQSSKTKRLNMAGPPMRGGFRL